VTLRNRIAILTLTISLFLLINPSLVKAIPPLPSSFYGVVKVNQANLPVGTGVQALINGKVVAESITQMYQGDSVYSLDVPGDDPSTASIEGGIEGDTITFKAGGLSADQTGLWHSATNISLNMTVTSASTPISPQITSTPIPTQTSVVLPQATLASTLTSTVTPTTTKTPTFVSTKTVTATLAPSTTSTRLPTKTQTVAAVSQATLTSVVAGSPTPSLTVTISGQPGEASTQKLTLTATVPALEDTRPTVTITPSTTNVPESTDVDKTPVPDLTTKPDFEQPNSTQVSKTPSTVDQQGVGGIVTGAILAAAIMVIGMAFGIMKVRKN
jgi:hypothetical protein